MLPRYSASHISEIGGPFSSAETVEHLDQLELVVEVVLEPQHDLVVLARAAERGVAILEAL